MIAKRLLCAVLLLMSGGCALSQSAPAQPERLDQWYAVFLADAKTGHAHASRMEEDGVVTNSETMTLSVQRFGVDLGVTATVKTRETVDGRPLGFTYEQRVSNMVTRKVGRLGQDGRLYMEIESGGRTTNSVIDWPEGALMPEGAVMALEDLEMEPGRKATFLYFDPETVTAIKATVTVGPMEEVDVLDRMLELRRMQTSLNYAGFAIKATSWETEDGVPMRVEVPLMGMKIVQVACPKEVALSPVEPSKFFDQTIVRIKPALTVEQQAGPLKWSLAPGKGAARVGAISTDEQAVQLSDDGRAEVTVRRLEMPAGVKMPYRGKDEAALDALKPNEWIQNDAPEIRKLAGEAVGSAQDAATAARNVEEFVTDYIDAKDLSVGYASALEVLKTKQGDCTEHALLCAALCRAVGVPARVAVGMAYAPAGGNRGMLVGHAWTQVYLQGKWYSIDAALRGFDAAHIVMSVGQGGPTAFMSMAQEAVFRVEGVEKVE